MECKGTAIMTKRKTIIITVLLACVLAAGCVTSDAPEVEDLPRLEERVMPTPTPAPALAPIRAPESPVETVASAPTPMPTPTPLNTTSTLCDYPPCGRGGGGGSSGSSGGGSADPPICELPTVLLVLAGIGVVAICARKE